MDTFDEVVWAQSLLLRALETPLAFTREPRLHSYDRPEGNSNCSQTSQPEGIPEIRHISQDPLRHSMASASAIQRISELKVISAIDPSNKPVTPADVENGLVDTDREGECGTKLSD